jgi:hypothetical protein
METLLKHLIYHICNLPEKKAGHLNYLLGSLKMKVRRPGGNHGSEASVYPCKVPLRPLCQITLKCI